MRVVCRNRWRSRTPPDRSITSQPDRPDLEAFELARQLDAPRHLLHARLQLRVRLRLRERDLEDLGGLGLERDRGCDVVATAASPAIAQLGFEPCLLVEARPEGAEADASTDTATTHAGTAEAQPADLPGLEPLGRGTHA